MSGYESSCRPLVTPKGEAGIFWHFYRKCKNKPTYETNIVKDWAKKWRGPESL